MLDGPGIRQFVNQTIFEQFIAPDRYPRQVGVLIERDSEGHWTTMQVGRWDDAYEVETRNRTVPCTSYAHLDWGR